MFIENNPMWERIDNADDYNNNNPDSIKWVRKDLNIYATCNIMDSMCTIIPGKPGFILPDAQTMFNNLTQGKRMFDDLKKYTTSLYTNPNFSTFRRKGTTFGQLP